MSKPELETATKDELYEYLDSVDTVSGFQDTDTGISVCLESGYFGTETEYVRIPFDHSKEKISEQSEETVEAVRKLLARF